jgi:hypothetical protein
MMEAGRLRDFLLAVIVTHSELSLTLSGGAVKFYENYVINPKSDRRPIA